MTCDIAIVSANVVGKIIPFATENIPVDLVSVLVMVALFISGAGSAALGFISILIGCILMEACRCLTLEKAYGAVLALGKAMEKSAPLAPIAITVTRSYVVDERSFLMAVTGAASFTALDGHQTYTMIYSLGRYRYADSARRST